ncbi:protein root UVB sensitive 4-like isoform X2 [Magnolia sinica]|uniref:protein root UVB sensitive 4-like isoform X2 n=1 Tax=Magnolia sinica TaxID=86752 RepID=UPI00265AAE49|nr:protein root UVB sensitive 4-like isoform X2 [Magnolia sinica]
MQSSHHTPSHSSPLPIPWKKTPTNLDRPSLSFSKPSPSSSPSTSHLRLINGRDGPAETEPLPIVIRRAGRASRYSWDGTHLRLVPFDCGGGESPDDRSVLFVDEIRRLSRISRSAIRKLFVPQQVQRNYMDYLKWKLLHRVFSSTLQVLATQAMFRAIGIGSSMSLPSAAALNWVLKDGLGRLSRCIYTASLGSAFDANLKRVRFSTSILFSLSIGVELLTPMFPQYFLLLATIANIAKSISLAAYLATGSAIHRSFAIADNLGEVSAKAQVTSHSSIGCISNFLHNRPVCYLPRAQTRTSTNINKDVSNEEGVFMSSRGSESWPIRIGCIDPKNISPKSSMLTMQSLRGEDFYFICMETSYVGLTRKRQQGILLCLQERAGSTDIVAGLLQACQVRKALQLSRHNQKCNLEDSRAEESIFKEWFEVVEDSRRYAQGEINPLMEAICRTGWAVKNILLNTHEQIRYSFVGD